MPLLALFSVAADPSLGRPSKSNLSSQTLMELFSEGITNRERICGQSDSPKDLSEWKGIDLNQNGHVVEISWIAWSLVGSVDVSWMPDSVKRLVLTKNELSGTLSMGDLSPDLVGCFCNINEFSGSADLPALPRKLERLNLSHNEFCGTLSLESLPETLVSLLLYSNKFEGSLNLTKLPECLQRILLCANLLHGCIDLTKLPRGLTELDLSNNRLSGETDLSKLPRQLFLNVCETHLEGEFTAGGVSQIVSARDSNVRIVRKNDEAQRLDDMNNVWNQRGFF